MNLRLGCRVVVSQGFLRAVSRFWVSPKAVELRKSCMQAMPLSLVKPEIRHDLKPEIEPQTLNPKTLNPKP